MESAIREMSTRGGAPKTDESFRFACEFIQKAEAYGFDITLVAERFLGPDLESWVLASALSSLTSRIELMVAVHPGIVNPQVAAKMGATLDRISAGRFAVNVVNGWWEREFNVYGNGSWLAQSDARYDRMEEFMRVMRGMWTEDVCDAAGKFFSAENAELPTKAFRQPSPPVYAASQAPAGKDAIARYADCWFYQQQANFRDFASASEQIERAVEEMSRLSAKYDRHVGIGISGHVICTDTMEEAERLATDLEQYGKGGTVNFIAATGLSATLVGTPDVIAERLDHYERLGLDLAMLHFHPMLDGLDRFHERVRPLLGSARSGGLDKLPINQGSAVHA
jgi:FMNH2-dependent dimethyl sulfone monooxygenase